MPKQPKKQAIKNEDKDEYKNYEEKEEIEWILDLPDTCIGSTDVISKNDDGNYYVYKGGKCVNDDKIKFIPGLYKIFDECAVNAADNCVRTRNMSGDNKCTEIRFEICKDKFSVENNGKPIPVMMHKEKKVWVPEMVFGRLRTSGNYKKGQKRMTGGKNGLGAKLALIFSTQTNITIIDKVRKKKYHQKFTDNIRTKTDPDVTTSTEENMVKIECFPDFKRFNKTTEFSQYMMDYLTRRVYDIAASTDKDVSIYLNGEQIKTREVDDVPCNFGFKEYVKLYEPDATDDDIMYSKPHKRWEIAVVKTDTSHQQVSFVNNIHTYSGGKHVTYVLGKIEDHLFKSIEKKSPGANKKFIRNYVHVYINCFIEEPSFDSQTKGKMTTNVTEFWSTFKFGKEFLKQLDNSGIAESVISFSEFKVGQSAKKTDGKKKANISGIIDLSDAKFAGTGKSSKCTLILTEGKSAKGLAIAGLSAEQREYFGVFPLRGKLLNVRDVSQKLVLGNAEITHIKQIMGLKSGVEITDVSKLRYGRVCLMTDADVDGFHIKGLLMNMFSVLWPSAFKLDHFIGSIRTPIIKATVGKKTTSFYTTPSFDRWYGKHSESDQKKIKIKYYKGLGTSTEKEGREYFKNLDKNMVFYTSTDFKDTMDVLDMAFNKKRPDDRKVWLGEYDESSELVYTKKNEASVKDVINKELIHFSNKDNIRSIPSVIDGLKEGQRKTLYGAFLTNCNTPTKVADLSSDVSKSTDYHHGEVSLHETIVKMAQHFIGANNINYFEPIGIFGSRAAGGSDHASARYIHTRLTGLIRKVIRSEDNPVLEHVYSDKQKIEPKFYCPILPMVLVNGSVGIGTGYSTNILSYNPLDLINNVRNKLDGKAYKDMLPYFDEFSGKVQQKNKAGTPPSYVTYGTYTINGNIIHITEIPIGTWSDDYKAYIDSLVIDVSPIKEKDAKKKDKIVKWRKKQFLKSYESICTPHSINITLVADYEMMSDHVMNGKLCGLLKLESKLSTTNMVMFDKDRKLHRYKLVSDIMNEFHGVRYEMYEKRIAHQLVTIKQDLVLISERVRFIMNMMDEKIIVFKRSNADIQEQLEAAEFLKIDDSYKHLLSIRISSFTKEKIEEMTVTKDDLVAQKTYLETTSINDQWRKELDELEVEYTAYKKKKHKDNKEEMKDDLEKKKKKK
jgi:DNA topoisomerase-2